MNAQTAAATPPSGNEDVITLEAFSVTGSNIKRIEQEKVLPVTIMNFEQIQARDSATPSDMLVALPQITNTPNNETNTNAAAARGGAVTIALRGLGAGNTLVLFNGRRMPFHPFNTQSVNVNTLPSTGIQQVEVLRDGASSIYGSDAVAGVVNYITRKDPAGTEVSMRFGVTEHGGAADYKFDLGYGRAFADGKGAWLTSFTFYDRDFLFWREREVSRSSEKWRTARAPWNVIGSPYDGLTQNGPWVQYRLGANNTTGTVWRVFPGSDGISTPTTAALPRQYYSDFNEFIIGQPRTTRYNLYNRIEYQLTDNIRAFGEITGYHSESRTGRQPIAINAADFVVTMVADNPYNPHGSRFYHPSGAPNSDGSPRLVGTPQPITIFVATTDDNGYEATLTRDAMVRFLAGVGGSFGGSSWTWESAMVYGHVDSKDYGLNTLRDSLLVDAGLRTDATAINPFAMTFKVDGNRVVGNQPYINPPNVRNGYTDVFTRFGQSAVFSADFRTTGNVIDLWAGPIAASAGIEFRREVHNDWRPPYHNFIPVGAVSPAGRPLDPNNNDFTPGSPTGNLFSSREISSAYAEAVFPLANPESKIPLVYSLEAAAAARFEDYSDFGQTTKPKFGVNWKPTSWAMVRGSINKGFTAPQLILLYQPSSFGTSSAPGIRDSVRSNHFVSGGQPVDVQVRVRNYSYSNPDLQPEESEGKSVGVAIDVPFVRGLSFTVDYWEIEQKNLIQARGRDTALDEQLLRAYTQAQLAKGVSINQIDVGSNPTPDGSSTYIGDPNTLRAPVTPTDVALFAAANANLPPSQWLAPLGLMVGTVSRQVNSTGRNLTNGFDYNVSYSLPNTPFGQFRFSTEWSQFLNKFTKLTPTSPKNDDIISMAIFEWKSNTTLQWRKDNWSGSISAVWWDDIRTGATTNAASYNALGQPGYIRPVVNNGTTTYYEVGEDALQFNAGLSYRFNQDANKWVAGTTIRLGINNLLDEQPSPAASTSGYNPTTGQSLWIGRAYSLQFTRQF